MDGIFPKVMVALATWMCLATYGPGADNPNGAGLVRLPHSDLPVHQDGPRFPTWPTAEAPVSLELRDAELADALELFRRQSGLQAVASPMAAKVRVSIRLDGLGPLAALDVLTKANGLWYRQDPVTRVIYVYTNQERLDVPPDIKALEAQVNAAFPNSSVELALVGDKLVVRGQAKDAIEADQIIGVIAANAWRPQQQSESDSNTAVSVNLANSQPGGGRFERDLRRAMSEVQAADQRTAESRVINLLTIPGVQQVMLCVTVAEINRSAGRSIGMNFNVNNSGGQSVVQSMVGGMTELATQGVVGAADDTVRAVLDAGQVTLAIKALREMKLARTLAEPNLTALNGERARFQAGGQFPVPVVGGFTNDGLQGVDFVPYGVVLDFTPYILERDRIRLKVSADVSAKSDDTTNVGGGNAEESSTGTVVPGLQTRNFGTTVELRSGQTLAVAGLIQTQYAVESKRIPFLGDLPIVGRFAGLDSTTSGETELVILVTPKLVQPIEECDRPPLPGSDVFEPGDVAFYLHGHLESRRSYDYRSSVRTDYHRQLKYEKCQETYIIGQSGYCGATPLPTPSP